MVRKRERIEDIKISTINATPGGSSSCSDGKKAGPCQSFNNMDMIPKARSYLFDGESSEGDASSGQRDWFVG